MGCRMATVGDSPQAKQAYHAACFNCIAGGNSEMSRGDALHSIGLTLSDVTLHALLYHTLCVSLPLKCQNHVLVLHAGLSVATAHARWTCHLPGSIP